MPAWLASALILVRSALFGTPVRAALTGAGAGLALGDDIPDIGGLIPGIPFIGEKKRRRRRRKALTANDMTLALTIASAISKKAAENFILSRVRAS